MYSHLPPPPVQMSRSLKNNIFFGFPYFENEVPAVLLCEGDGLLLGGEVEDGVGQGVRRAGPAHQVVLPPLTSVELDLPP